ncbi:MAG: hypothetical protein WDO15_20365 [Bacteroidota bacterium]
MDETPLTRHSGSLKRYHNTEFEYDKQVDVSRYKYVVERISELSPINNKVIYIFGAGKHSKITYKSLEGIKGIEVAYYYSVLPTILKPLSIVVASYAGIVKILDNSELSHVFKTLVYRSMAGLYIFDKGIEAGVIDVVKREKDIGQLDSFIKENDRGYFIYQVDADNKESSTGIYEIVSYGVECPEGLTTVLQLS